MAILQSSAITGSLTVSGSQSNLVQLQGSGSTVFSVNGASGQLFGVSDDLTDSLFSVNTIAGLPVIEAFADNTVKIGTFGSEELIVSESQVSILSASLSGPTLFLDGNVGIGVTPTEKLEIAGDVKIQGADSGNAGVLHFGNDSDQVKISGFDSGGSSVQNSLLFYTNTNERMRLDSNGNVGIGTTSPSAKLDIVGGGGNTSPTLELNTTTSATFNHAINAFNSNLTAGENQVIVFGKEGSTKNSGYIGYTWNGAGFNSNVITIGHWASDNLVNIDALGNVGIGTTSPGFKLQVATPQETTDPISFAFDITRENSTGRGMTFGMSADNLYGAIGTHNADLQLGHTFGTEAGGQPAFYPTMTIQHIDEAVGNVGIGTTSPNANLHVVSAGSAYIKAERTTAGSEGQLTLGATNSDNRIYSNGVNTSTGKDLVLTFGGVDTHAFNSNGNVGIGTTSPAKKLTIDSGDLLFTGNYSSKLVVNGDNTANTPMLLIGEQQTYGVGFRWNSGRDLDIVGYDNANVFSTSGVTMGKFITSNGLTTANGIFYWGGNVGIGTTSPSTKLEVNGGSKFNELVTVVGDIYPETNYVSNIGAINKKFLTLNVAELIVETLVASERRSTVGGRFNVGISTQLSQSLASGSTTIIVENNNLNNGDIIHLEGGVTPQVEFMKVTSSYTDVAGDGYSYEVERNLDDTGANNWDAGSGVFNTGQIGNGFIDQYAINSLTSGSGVNTAGPTIAFMERTGSLYPDIDIRAGVGNLKGWYGYTTESFGFAAGNYKAQNITVDPTNGLRIRDIDEIQLQAQAGSLTIGDSFLYDSDNGVLFVSGSNIDLVTPSFFLGNSSQFISGSNGNLQIESTNFTVATNGDVSLTGTISAEAGNIGGFAITDSAITGSGFLLSGSATGNEFFISSSKFNVKANGDVTASNASLIGGTIGDIEINGTAGSLTSGEAFIDTFSAAELDDTLWYNNSSNAGEQAVIVNGALRLQNDNDNWDYGIVGRKSFSRSNSPVFVFHFKVLTTTGALNEPRIMIGVTDDIAADSYTDNVHSIYFSGNNITAYESTSNRGTISSGTVSAGDTYKLIMEPQSSGFDYTIYKNENYTTPFLEGSIGSFTEATLYPSIQILAQSSTVEFYSIYAYDSTTPGGFDIKQGGSFGFVNNSGSEAIFSQGGFSLRSPNIDVTGDSLRLGDTLKFDGSNLIITGSINATSGNFTGTISAGDGDIGGWTINNGNLSATNITLSSDNQKIDVGSGIDINGTGDSNAGSIVIGSNVTLNGSSDSSISGWTIGTNITGGNIELDSGGSIRHTSDLWKINNDGSGLFADNNINFDASGNFNIGEGSTGITFSNTTGKIDLGYNVTINYVKAPQDVSIYVASSNGNLTGNLGLGASFRLDDYGYTDVTTNLGASQATIEAADPDLVIFDHRNWGINAGTSSTPYQLYSSGSAVLTIGNDTTSGHWMITSHTGVSGAGVWNGTLNQDLPTNHPFRVSPNTWTQSTSDSGFRITNYIDDIEIWAFHTNFLTSPLILVQTNEKGGIFMHIQDGFIYDTDPLIVEAILGFLARTTRETAEFYPSFINQTRITSTTIEAPQIKANGGRIGNTIFGTDLSSLDATGKLFIGEWSSARPIIRATGNSTNTAVQIDPSQTDMFFVSNASGEKVFNVTKTSAITLSGFTVANTQLHTGTKSTFASTAAGVYVGTDGIALGTDSPFNVKANGDLTASNANITGDITATNITATTAGNIAGWSVGANTLSSGNVNLSNASNQKGLYISAASGPNRLQVGEFGDPITPTSSPLTMASDAVTSSTPLFATFGPPSIGFDGTTSATNTATLNYNINTTIANGDTINISQPVAFQYLLSDGSIVSNTTFATVTAQLLYGSTVLATKSIQRSSVYPSSTVLNLQHNWTGSNLSSGDLDFKISYSSQYNRNSDPGNLTEVYLSGLSGTKDTPLVNITNKQALFYQGPDNKFEWTTDGLEFRGGEVTLGSLNSQGITMLESGSITLDAGNISILNGGIDIGGPNSHVFISETDFVDPEGYKLFIDSDTPEMILMNRANVGTISMIVTGSTGQPEFAIRRTTSNTEVFRIDNNDNVGIGTASPSAKLQVEGSGSTILDIQGSQGQLFSVTDDLTGTLFSVNDISGIPILSVDSDDTVTMGTFGANALVVSGSKVGIGTDTPSEKLQVEGNISASGNIIIADGQGIDFSATGELAGMTSELLDDYEEGTWTPEYGHTSGNPSTEDYDETQTYGKYTKIGDIVHCSGRIRTNEITWSSTTSNTVIKGFPFTCSSPLSTGTGCVAGVIGFAGGFSATKPVAMQMRSGQTQALLYGESITSNEVQGQPNIKSGDFTTGTNASKNFITFQITYHTT